MRAKLKSYNATDVQDLNAYRPADPRNFRFTMELFIGPDSEEGEETFQVTVCTPDWLKSQHGPNDVVVGRHHLIVFEFDLKRIVRFIEEYCANTEGSSWHEIGEKLGRLGYWEFEDYQPA